MRKFLFFLLCTVTFYLLASCEKEEHLDGKGDKPLVDTPKDTIQEEFLLKWDTFIDDSNDNGEIFIGTQYLGVSTNGLSPLPSKCSSFSQEASK